MGVALSSIAVLLLLWVDPFGGRPDNRFGVVIDSPYIGQGVSPGTELLMHGVKIGEVTTVTSLPAGGVRVGADMERKATAGLTDTFGIDFRPANYFGVTGINVTPGVGGRALAEGSVIEAVPSGNFTLQSLLSRLGEISHGVVTPHLIETIEKTTHFADSLTPLLETMLVVSETLARVQNVSTAQLLTNATGISVAFPGLVDALVTLGDHYVHASLDNVTEDFFVNTFTPTIDLTANSLFGAAGKLVSSHSTELAPVTDLIKRFSDIAPGLVPSDEIADTARDLRVRLERLFAGPPDRRAVNVRVILDVLPAVAATADAVGGTPQ
ncbi:Mammalian cell entry related domain protein [Mycobacterium koreense]|nr:Mammalian cell entry related domain protein [Mycolicibacillus koreensis]